MATGRQKDRKAVSKKAPPESSRGPAELLARIPSMTELLKAAESDNLMRAHPTAVVGAALRQAVDDLRNRLRAGRADLAAGQVEAEHRKVAAGVPADRGSAEEQTLVKAVLRNARRILESRQSRRLRRVINATGVVLHTGLGRSVLPAAAVRQITEVAAGYCSLEIDLETGRRGQRGRHVEELLCELTGGEAALVVNNNAAATMLALHTLARGREVVVSRGQLIEIGGSFRLPEVMAAGGAILREVGTTNKTRLRDYEAAIGEKTAMIMHVHTSNYRVVGFSESPVAAELTELAHRHGLPMFDDLGSGAILDDELWAAASEPTVAASLRAGADFVSFSGDKLLGGPQAGILLGKREMIEKLRRDPMARALRVDKLTIAALEAVLELYHDPARAKREIPLLARLSEPLESLKQRAEDLAGRLRSAMPNDSFVVKEDESFAGGGSLPAWPFPTAVVAWRPAGGISIDEITCRLRLGDPAVLCRIHEGAIYLDMRTVEEGEYEQLIVNLRLTCETSTSRC